MKCAPKPLTQGDVSGDCVFYSALNAVRWLWPEYFGEHEACEALFEELVKRWSKRHGSIDALIAEGTESNAGWMTAQIMSELVRERGYSLICEPTPADLIDQKPNTAEFFDWLQAQLDSDQAKNTCAVVGLDDPWNHWTVVRRISSPPARIFFFDSWGVQRLTWKLARSFSTVAGAWKQGKTEIDLQASVIYRRMD